MIDLKDALEDVAIIEIDEAWQRMNIKACTVIIQCVSDPHKEYTKDLDCCIQDDKQKLTAAH